MCLNKTSSKARICKNRSDAFPIHNGLKQGDALSPLLFNFALECAIRKVCVEDVTIMGENIDTINKNGNTVTG
jgi:hypothetical protein